MTVSGVSLIIALPSLGMWSLILFSSVVALGTIVTTYSIDFPVQIPTRIPEKIVVALFSGILVNSGILVVAERVQITS